MVLFSALSLISQTSNAISRSVEVFSRDISFATDPNYQRQIIEYDSGRLFQGLSLGSVTRAVNQNLQDRLLSQSAGLGNAEAVEGYFNEISLESQFDGTAPELERVFVAFEQNLRDYQTSPESDAVHSRVIQGAVDIATHLNEFRSFLNGLSARVDEDITTDINRVNSLTIQIRTLNRRISVARPQNIVTVGLENQRDSLLRELSSIVEIREIRNDNGTTDAYLRSGHVLISHTTAARLLWNPANREISVEGTIGTLVSAIVANNTNGLPPGSLSARYNFARTDADALISEDHNVGAIEKFQQQLNILEQSLVTDDPVFSSSFNVTYSNAVTNVGEFNGNVFALNAVTGAVEVNALLVAGTERFKLNAVTSTDISSNVLNAWQENSLTIPIVYPAGATLPVAPAPDLARYLRLDSAVGFNAFISSITEIQGNGVIEARDSRSFEDNVEVGLRRELLNDTGVNVDETLLLVRELQENFTANARLIQYLDRMLENLFNNV